MRTLRIGTGKAVVDVVALEDEYFELIRLVARVFEDALWFEDLV